MAAESREFQHAMSLLLLMADDELILEEKVKNILFSFYLPKIIGLAGNEEPRPHTCPGGRCQGAAGYLLTEKAS